MKTFSQWCLLLALWAIVVIALFLGSPVHAQFAAGSASSSSSSTTTTTTTNTQTAAPQILQLPTMAYQAPLAVPLPVCPTMNFGAPLGYGASFGAGYGYGRSFGFNRFGAGFGYGHSVGFRRGFAAPVYGGVGFAAPAVSSVRVNVAAPVAVAVPRKQVIRQRTRIRIR